VVGALERVGAQAEELGTRSVTMGSCQTSKPWERCSMKTIFHWP